MAESGDPHIPTIRSPQPELTARERDLVIRSIISSEALAGVELTYDEVATILDEVLRSPWCFEHAQ